MPKTGDVVRYVLGDREYNAIVLFAHVGQPAFLGKNREPLLHVGFIAPERESDVQKSKPGYIPQFFIEYDVVHESQEFSDEYKRNNGLLSPAQIASHRGAGEWKDVEVAKPSALAFVKEYVTPAPPPAIPESPFLPSAADLDAVEHEQQAADETIAPQGDADPPVN